MSRADRKLKRLKLKEKSAGDFFLTLAVPAKPKMPLEDRKNTKRKKRKLEKKAHK